MCFHFHIKKDKKALEQRFKAKMVETAAFEPLGDYNGFNYPQTPVITNNAPDSIQLFQWGLLPNWVTDIDFRKNTLNAKIETMHEKPSFKNVMSQRCLVLVDGFYEWQWLDAKGKQKQKYFIAMPDEDTFAFAGLWNNWLNRTNGQIISTFSILTTEANEQMSIIHNTKKRMPMILKKEEENAWLEGFSISPKREFPLLTIKV